MARVLLPALLMVVASCSKQDAGTKTDARPEIVRVAATEVTVAWRTRKAVEGRLTYAPVDDPDSTGQAADAAGPGEWHEVVIKGLRPGTRYSYTVSAGTQAYEFQTQPISTMPFTFLFTCGQPDDTVAGAVLSELPEFVLSMTPLKNKTIFAPIRPYMPVYDLHGASSPYLTAMGDATTSATRAPGWALDWGGLRLVFTAGTDALGRRLEDAVAHTIGVVWASNKTRDWVVDGEIDAKRVRALPVHAMLTTHTGRHREHPVAFVFFLAARPTSKEIDGIMYVGMPAEAKRCSVARIDVSVEATRMTVLGTGKEVLLRKPPLKQKRTCEECRRLADQGAYEASVEAYENFIKTNPAHFQIDDAYFAVAEILDEKLFRFKDALVWYERLIDAYPDSTLTPAARLRLNYLKARADHDFRPLAAFERIRRVDYCRARQSPAKRDKVLAQLQACLLKYPDCALAAEMRYWLANQLRTFDVDRAAAAYRDLVSRNPASTEAKNAWLEMGEGYYDAGRYREALAVYTEALNAIPEQRQAVEKQIARSRRNLRRGHVAVVAALVVLLGLLIPGLVVPRYFHWRRVVMAGIVGSILFILMAGGASLIHEQFESFGIAMKLCAGFALSAVAAFPGLAALGCRLGGAKGRLLAVASNLFFMLAGCYLTIYHLNEHYLIILKM